MTIQSLPDLASANKKTFQEKEGLKLICEVVFNSIMRVA
jgi:hypothetical protein